MNDWADLEEPSISFVGIHLQAGKQHSAASYLVDKSGDETTVCLHVTQAALGDKPKPGRTTVFAIAGGAKFAIGSLLPEHTEQFSLDLMLAKDVTFLAQGANDVYLTGYKTISPQMPGGTRMMEDSDEDDDSEEDDELPPTLVSSATPAKLAAAKPGTAKAKGAAVPKANGLKQNEFPKLSNGVMDDLDEDDDSELDDEDDDDDGIKFEDLPPAAQEKLKALTAEAALAGEDDDDEDDDDDDLDDDDALMGGDSDDDDDELELPPKAGKRAAAAAAAAPSGKKQKGASGAPVAAAAAAAPAAAAAAKPSTAAAGGDAGALKTYVASLQAYVTKNGATKLSELGSKVKKPQGLNTKLTKAINESGIFNMSSSQEVSLK